MKAIFDEQKEAYITECGNYASDDGNEWINVQTGELEAPDGVINFVGGFRNGESVA